MPPILSHRYIAACSGVGSFGWSGNVGIKGYGTIVELGTVVTSAELNPLTYSLPKNLSAISAICAYQPARRECLIGKKKTLSQ